MSQESYLKDFIEECDKHFITNLPNGSTTSLEDFYNKVVLINSPKKEIVEQWHILLLQYINDEDAIFFIRRYSSAPKKDWTKIRRGFLTEYDCGIKYVFCDNYFAHYFFMMAMKGIVPSYEEFKEIILNRELPYGYMVTSQEKPFQAFKKGKAVNINKAGWKLDHINSVNGDYSFDYKFEKNELFPIGNQSDWIEKKGYDYFSRNITLSPINIENHKEKIIAHFLRLVHPMNYFLTPQKNRINFDIGSSYEMIDFVRQKNKNIYGHLYTEFEKLIFIKHSSDFSKPIPEIINFGFNQIKKIKTNVNNKSKNISKIKINYIKDFKSDLNIVKAYLIDGKSYRKIEKDLMNIDSQKRGGGFIAKNILNSYGVMAKHKGVISVYNIDIAIKKTSGVLNETLNALKVELMDIK